MRDCGGEVVSSFTVSFDATSAGFTVIVWGVGVDSGCVGTASIVFFSSTGAVGCCLSCSASCCALVFCGAAQAARSNRVISVNVMYFINQIPELFYLSFIVKVFKYWSMLMAVCS